PGACLELEPVAVEPRQRLSVAVRGVEPHPAVQAARLHRAPRLHAAPVPAGRLPAEALRRSAPLEGRHAAGRAARRSQSGVTTNQVTTNQGQTTIFRMSKKRGLSLFLDCFWCS